MTRLFTFILVGLVLTSQAQAGSSKGWVGVAKVLESYAAREAMVQIYGRVEWELREIVESVVAEKEAEPNLQIEKFLSITQIKGLQQTVSPPPLSGFSTFPTDAKDWEYVFDRPASYNDLSGTKTQNDKLDTEILSRRPRYLPQSVTEFRNFLDLTSSTVITIIGHNDGEALVVPPRYRLPLDDMSDECARAQKICLFFSCDTSEKLITAQRVRAAAGATGAGVSLGSDRYLTVADGVELAQKALRVTQLAIDQKLTREQLLQALGLVIQETESAQGRRHVMTLYGPPIGLTAAGAFIFVSVGGWGSSTTEDSREAHK